MLSMPARLQQLILFSNRYTRLVTRRDHPHSPIVPPAAIRSCDFSDRMTILVEQDMQNPFPTSLFSATLTLCTDGGDVCFGRSGCPVARTLPSLSAGRTSSDILPTLDHNFARALRLLPHVSQIKLGRNIESDMETGPSFPSR